jgi:hypothetical protein
MDAPYLKALYLREVGQVEADMLIAIGPHYIGDMVVSA